MRHGNEDRLVVGVDELNERPLRGFEARPNLLGTAMDENQFIVAEANSCHLR